MSLLNELLHDLAQQKPAKQIPPILMPVLLKNSKKAIKNRHRVLFVLACMIIPLVILIFFKKPAQPPSIQSAPKKTVSSPQITPQEIVGFRSDTEIENRSSALVNKIYTPKTLEEWHDALFHKAFKAIDQGFDQQAIDILNELLVKIPDAADARENLTSLYLSMGDYAQAKQVVNDGLSYAPSHIGLLTMKARLFLDQNNTHDAIKLLSKHHPAMSKHPDFYATLAAAYQSEGLILESGSLYKSLLQIDTNNGQYWLGYAMALEYSHQSHQAIKAYIRACEDPDTDLSVRDYAANRLKTLQG